MTTYDQAIDEFIQLLITGNIAAPHQIVPCSDEDLGRLVRAAGPLPGAYRSFLQRVGRGAGRFWKGSDAFIPEILHLQTEDVQSLAVENGVVLPSHDMLPFFSHQGYEYRWMQRTGADDPPVWQILETRDSARIELRAPSFTAHLLKNARALADRLRWELPETKDPPDD